MVDKGGFPAPDYRMKENVVIRADSLDLNYDNNSLKKNSSGHYVLNLQDQLGKVQLSLVFEPMKNAVRHGKDGIVKSSINESDDMFYYFISENTINGSLLYKEESYTIKGSGWYDHEFSYPYNRVKINSSQKSRHWTWFAIQFENHCQLTAYQLLDKDSENLGNVAVWINEEGESVTIEDKDIFIEPLEYHISKQTCVKYPIAWRLQIRLLTLDLLLEAEFPQQEVVTLLKSPGFWEGRVKVNGTLKQESISGKAFVEITTGKGWNNLDELLDEASGEILTIVHKIIPNANESEGINMLMEGGGYSYLKAIPHAVLHEALIQPLKDMVDRKGKSWRSHLLRLLAGLSGGNPDKYDELVAFLQILHCSSLIIDDVQDQSPLRRGGLSCHEIYGIPLAINSGCFGYFIGEKLIRDMNLSDAKNVQIYQTYFDAMRFCHGGQALDLRTFSDKLPEAFASG